MSAWPPEPAENRITADVYRDGEWERFVNFKDLRRGDVAKMLSADRSCHIHPWTHEPDEDVAVVIDGDPEECLQRMRGYAVPVCVYDSLKDALRRRAS